MPRRYKFTASEYADMIFVYGECHGNTNLAIQKYRERYGNSRICPARETITNAFQRIRENQCLVPLDSASPRASRQNVGRSVKEDSSEESGEESEEEDEEGGEEEDVEGGDEEDVEGSEEEVISDESDTSADKKAKRPPTEPKSKRGRPAAAVGKGRKAAVAKASAKATPAKRKAPTPPGTKNGGAKPVGRPMKKGKKASSEESGGSEEEDEEGVEEEESGEESDTPADKKAKRPPTDEEIKKYVEQILEGANLDQITMKMVCEQVYSHYPDFDLAHKKEFIRATVKSCIKGEE